MCDVKFTCIFLHNNNYFTMHCLLYIYIGFGMLNLQCFTYCKSTCSCTMMLTLHCFPYTTTLILQSVTYSTFTIVFTKLCCCKFNVIFTYCICMLCIIHLSTLTSQSCHLCLPKIEIPIVKQFPNIVINGKNYSCK